MLLPQDLRDSVPARQNRLLVSPDLHPYGAAGRGRDEITARWLMPATLASVSDEIRTVSKDPVAAELKQSQSRRWLNRIGTYFGAISGSILGMTLSTTSGNRSGNWLRR
jgi:hypothetical protein